MTNPRLMLIAFGLGCMLVPPCGASAQDAQSPPVRGGTRDSAPAGPSFFSSRDALLAGSFTGLTLAMLPLDRRLAHAVRDSAMQANRFVAHASRGMEILADPGSILIGASLYGVGRLTGWREVTDLGLHGTEAIAVAGGVASLLKGVMGRARPYVSRDTNPGDFRFGRGFSGGSRYQSFPSGHTTVAFAAAAAVTTESRRWWPTGTCIVAPVMYGGAALVGLSRMYHDAHWASDVALGAGIGTFAGLHVVRYAHQHPDNAVSRVLLPMHVMRAEGRGTTVWWSLDVGRSGVGIPEVGVPRPATSRATREGSE
ncbi:MAG TPA: phosphatase PAP2 family protein [Gemmatimonadaceae bacterium]